MSREEAIAKAKQMLATDFVAGISGGGSQFGNPRPDEIERLADLLMHSEEK